MAGYGIDHIADTDQGVQVLRSYWTTSRREAEGLLRDWSSGLGEGERVRLVTATDDNANP